MVGSKRTAWLAASGRRQLDMIGVAAYGERVGRRPAIPGHFKSCATESSRNTSKLTRLWVVLAWSGSGVLMDYSSVVDIGTSSIRKGMKDSPWFTARSTSRFICGESFAFAWIRLKCGAGQVEHRATNVAGIGDQAGIRCHRRLCRAAVLRAGHGTRHPRRPDR